MMNAVIITNTIPSVKMIHWPPSSACNNYLYMMRTITLLRCIKTNNQNYVFALKKEFTVKISAFFCIPKHNNHRSLSNVSVYSPGLSVLTLSSNTLLYLMVSRLKPVYFSMKGF